MPVNGYEFVTGEFQDVQFLLEQVEQLYAEKIIPKGGPDKFQACADRIVPHRKWEPAMPLIRENLLPVLRDLNICYVPKQLNPGPCFLFPHYDTHGDPVRGKINPLGWELMMHEEVAKYGLLGLKHAFKGPTWIGNSDRVIELMIKTRFAVLVEGPYDTVACRVLQPDVPTLSSGTKSLNEMHIIYLAMLGVKNVGLLMDDEVGKTAGEWGAGTKAAVGARKVLAAHGISSEVLKCPAGDPSQALESQQTAFQLKSLLAEYLQ